MANISLFWPKSAKNDLFLTKYGQKWPISGLFMGSHGSHRAFSRLPYASHGSHRAWSKEPYVRKSPISCISKMWPFSLQIEDLLKDSKLRQFLRLIAKAISILFRDFVSLREISSKFRIKGSLIEDWAFYANLSIFYPKISDFGRKKGKLSFFIYFFLWKKWERIEDSFYYKT